MRPDYAPMSRLPAPASSRLIDFEKIEIIVLESFPPQFVLVVSGTKPFLNMDVSLEPLVFVRQPEYWGIEVVGRLPGGIGLPAIAPYSVSIPLAGITGTQGIEVIGANRTERREIGDHRPTETLDVVYELRGEDAQLTLRISKTSDAVELRFQDAELDRRFSGAEIRRQPSEVGELLTVNLADTPDVPLVKLTLLLPLANTPNAGTAPIETQAIISTDRSASFTAEPPVGQLMTYRFLPLSGTVRLEPSRASLLFSRDDRPADGELREIKIVPQDGSTFDATLHTAHFDRIAGQEVESTEELAAGLTCTITDAVVTCSRDDRPADGLLKELVVSRNAEGTFDATLRTASFDQIDGTEVDETKEIGSGLTRS
jgi:hypothetical protein